MKPTFVRAPLRRRYRQHSAGTHALTSLFSLLALILLTPLAAQADETLTVDLDPSQMMVIALTHPQDLLGGQLTADVRRIAWETGSPSLSGLEILSQPEPLTISQGQALQLSVSAAGHDLRYFWRHNGIPLVEQRDSQLLVPVAGPEHSGWYSVLVNQGGEFELSHTVYVEVDYDSAVPQSAAMEAAEGVPLSLLYYDDDYGGSAEYPTYQAEIPAASVITTALTDPRDLLGSLLTSEIQRIQWHASGQTQSRQAVFYSQPEPTRLQQGQDLLLYASVKDPDARVFWRHNGVPLENQRGHVLQVNAAGMEHAGWYTALVLVNGEFHLSDSVMVAFDFSSHLQSMEGIESARLRWGAPTQREDGSPMANTEITSYRIYHGTEDLGWVTEYEIPNSDPMSYLSFEIPNLIPARHVFAITAIDRYGQESEPSIVGFKDVEANI